MDYLSTAWTGVSYVVYPIVYILFLILNVLSIITAPVLHLGHYVLFGCLYPIHILAKFETLYIFFGVAVLVGLLTGTSLHYASAFLTSVFNLQSTHEELRGRSLSSYRAEKQGRSEGDSLPMAKQRGILPIADRNLKEEYVSWERLNKDRGRHKNGLIPNTILEEEDSTEDGF